MTAAGRFHRYPVPRRFRVPRADGEILCIPPRDQLLQLLQNNRKQLSGDAHKLWGQPLAGLAAEARREALAGAWQYTRSYANVSEQPNADCPLIFIGHQPELVHPGVWLKNFAAAHVAKASAGIGVNLIIDSDLCRKTAIVIPTGTVSAPRLATIEYDAQHKERPYEEREILDPACWNSFGERATKTLRTLVDSPVASSWWKDSAVQSRATNNLGLALAQARHRLELEWGSETWEIPQSMVCQTASFRRFAVGLLQEASRFRGSYNDSLAEYRTVHHLRNPAQPMPDLIEAGDWCETPFWVWTCDQPHRRALYVQRQRGRLLLSDLAAWHGELPTAIEPAMERLATWEHKGVKLRTRALATTLYTRLLLADLFIHGIGGSKYDEVTDAICQRFFEICPPSYATLTGTLRLPIDHPIVEPNQTRRLRQELRDLEYHPERHVGRLESDRSIQRQLEDWVSKKSSWVKTAKTPANATQRHLGIVAANAAMQPLIAPLRVRCDQELARVAGQTRVNQLLESREYPFCLFPPEQLRHFLLDF